MEDGKPWEPQSIDLDKAEISLDNLIYEFNDSLESKADEFAKEYAQENNKNLDELLTAPPSRLVAYVPMRFVPEEESTGEVKAKPVNIEFMPLTNVRVSFTQRPEPKK